MRLACFCNWLHQHQWQDCILQSQFFGSEKSSGDSRGTGTFIVSVQNHPWMDGQILKYVEIHAHCSDLFVCSISIELNWGIRLYSHTHEHT